MPKMRIWRQKRRERVADPDSRSMRESLLEFLRNWNRIQVIRILAAMTLAWVVGAIGIYLSEGKGNASFDTPVEALWSVWIMLFSGLDMDEAPKTAMGRFFSMVVLGTGAGLAGLFTGTVASILVEHQLRSRDVTNFEMEDHLVLCNWSSRGLECIREVHAKTIQDKRPVVIIHDDTEQIDLPDKQDDAAFNDVYIVRGDPTNDVVLRRARVPRAHSVVVLNDERQGTYADGKSILTCIAIREICKGDNQPNIAVECQNAENRRRLIKSGADEIISSDELGLRLLARTAIYHGMTRVYQELLTVGRDANEMYLIPVPEALVGRDFVEISSMFLRYREDKRSCLLIGLQRGENMMLNPVGNEAGPLKASDELILLSRVFHNPSQVWPTVPPVNPTPPTP